MRRVQASRLLGLVGKPAFKLLFPGRPREFTMFLHRGGKPVLVPVYAAFVGELKRHLKRESIGGEEKERLARFDVTGRGDFLELLHSFFEGVGKLLLFLPDFFRYLLVDIFAL